MIRSIRSIGLLCGFLVVLLGVLAAQGIIAGYNHFIHSVVVEAVEARFSAAEVEVEK